jgi:UDP-N-acetylglucosamine:LPS N-acetylglucosamine transferase
VTDVLVVCSPGGHFSEARDLMNGIDDISFKYVVHLLPKIPAGLVEKIIIAPHAERDLRILKQFVFAVRCIRRERPKIIVSTGALIGATFAIAAKALHVKVVFVESPTRITKPSLTARIVYPLADRFYVRWPQLLKWFPRALWRNDQP